MADFLGNDHMASMPPWFTADRTAEGAARVGVDWSLALGSAPAITMYKMRGEDALADGLYDTWLATGAPDLDGSDYEGDLVTPLRDVIVIDTWTA
jgi:hypothetical protein